MDVKARSSPGRSAWLPVKIDVLRRRHEARLRLLEAGVSRRRFLGVSVAAPGLLLASRARARAAGQECEPQPIPEVLVLGGGLPDIHVQIPGLVTDTDTDPSTITDFNGNLGYAVIDGTGVHTDKVTGAVATFPFEVDLRFMTGEFLTAGGHHCHGTFALI